MATSKCRSPEVLRSPFQRSLSPLPYAAARYPSAASLSSRHIIQTCSYTTTPSHTPKDVILAEECGDPPSGRGRNGLRALSPPHFANSLEAPKSSEADLVSAVVHRLELMEQNQGGVVKSNAPKAQGNRSTPWTSKPDESGKWVTVLFNEAHKEKQISKLEKTNEIVQTGQRPQSQTDEPRDAGANGQEEAQQLQHQNIAETWIGAALGVSEPEMSRPGHHHHHHHHHGHQQQQGGYGWSISHSGQLLINKGGEYQRVMAERKEKEVLRQEGTTRNAKVAEEAWSERKLCRCRYEDYKHMMTVRWLDSVEARGKTQTQ